MLALSEALNRKLLFVHGKGGVGKTLIARALAENQIARLDPDDRVLLIQVDDPRVPEVKIVRHPSRVDTLNATVIEAFLEYAGLKLNSSSLARFLLDHKLITYLVEAAPGMKELSIIGKIWYETRNYATVIVDMPSTGHAITLFRAFRSWADIFENSPIARDSAKIEAVLQDPRATAHLLLALPEEMPLTESEELAEELEKLFPGFAHAFLINRVTPAATGGVAPPSSTNRAFAATASEHFARRRKLEAEHLAGAVARKPLLLPNFVPGHDPLPEMRAAIADALRAGKGSA